MLLWNWKAEPADYCFWWANWGSSFKEMSGMLCMQAEQPTVIWIQQPFPAGWKTGGEPNEWEKWNVTTKLCRLNSFHSNTKRKKEARSDKRNSLPQSSKRAWMCLACGVPEVYKKPGSMCISGSAICRSCVSSLVGRGLWHMQISASQDWYKMSNLGIVVVAFVASQ